MWREDFNNIANCEIHKAEQLYKVSTPWSDDHQFKKEELEKDGDLSRVFSKIVLKRLYVARNGRPDIPWSVHKLAQTVTTKIDQNL